MVPRGQSTFTCACQGHPECRVHPQGHARQPLSHWVIIQGLTDTSKHKEHLRKKCPQGQCVVPLVRSDTMSPGLLAPASTHQQNKTEEVDVEHTFLKKHCSHLWGCTWVPRTRNKIYTSFQPGWATTCWSSGWVWSHSFAFSKHQHKLWASFICTNRGMLKWEVGKWARRRYLRE